jgi:hypothetical protein
MITVDIPGDAEFLAAFGEVALRHAHLDHILRMTIKTLADLRPNEALDATHMTVQDSSANGFASSPTSV